MSIRSVIPVSAFVVGAVAAIATTGTTVSAQIRILPKLEQPNQFLAGWLKEQLDRDIGAATEIYQKTAGDEDAPKTQRALAIARLGERALFENRRQDLKETYKALAALGIDPGNTVPATLAVSLGVFRQRLRAARKEPDPGKRKAYLQKVRNDLFNKMDGRNRVWRRVSVHPILRRVVQETQRPPEVLEGEDLQELRKQRLKALEQGNSTKAQGLLRQINRKRQQLPSRYEAILLRLRGKRKAHITELYLNDEPARARQREQMLFPRRPRQQQQISKWVRRLSRTNSRTQRAALAEIGKRVQHLANRPSISLQEREVLRELKARLEKLGRDGDVMEAIQLVAQLPYREELLQGIRINARRRRDN